MARRQARPFRDILRQRCGRARVFLGAAALAAAGCAPPGGDGALSSDEVARVRLPGTRIPYAVTQWPTAPGPLSSPFGPRLQASQNYAYDFHRGIDIPGDLGQPIRAVADGEIYRTYWEGEPGNPYPNSGTVVITRHTFDTPFPLHASTHDRYYALYAHLDSILVPAAVPGGPYDSVARGDTIGTMGQSGTTTFTHLHFEIRVGTLCSREYQQSHPEASCATYFGSVPQDPHVNPLLLLDYTDGDACEVTVLQRNPLRVLVRSDRDELDFNEIRVVLGRTEKVVNLNDRTGIDPADIDNDTYDGVAISPAQFRDTSTSYEITFELTDFPDFDSILVRDIWGKGIRLLRRRESPWLVAPSAERGE